MNILVKTYRGDVLDLFYTGHVAVVDYQGKLIYSAGNPGKVAFARSSAKLMQAMVALDSGAVDAYQLTQQELAQICASHSGEQLHTDTVRSILNKAGLNESYLQCGAHYPFYEPLTETMKAKGIKPTDIHNNCSGKHAGMLITAKYLGENLSDYYKQEHPHQQRILNMLSNICEYDREKIKIGVDGCGVPVHAMPLNKFAYGMARMCKAESLGERYGQMAQRVVQAVMDFPLNVSGTERIDYKIMSKYPNKIVLKAGANGYFIGGIPQKGIGFTIKIDDGNSAAAGIVLIETLHQLGIIPKQDLEYFADEYAPKVFNHKKELAGYSQSCFMLKNH